MNFEKLLATFDMGVCADQVQREALFDLAILFVEIDGIETPQEQDFIDQWVDKASWDSHLSKAQYREQAVARAKEALQTDHIDNYIKQKAAYLSHSSIKDQAVALVEDIVVADGELAEVEANAVKLLRDYLQA